MEKQSDRNGKAIKGSSLQIRLAVKRRIFVSYHHGGDQAYYDHFSKVFGELYEVIFDNSLERAVDSDDPRYVMRRIRENYVTGSSCTVVLCGRNTWQRKYVDWEILATLEKQHGLIGICLPTAQVTNNGIIIPARLYDNIQSGYAIWVIWDTIIQSSRQLTNLIEMANSRFKTLIRNDRERKLRNG